MLAYPVMVDRVVFGNGEAGPFSAALEALQKLEVDLETWELQLEEERATLCREVLGVENGDDLVFQSRGNTVRMQLDSTSLFMGNESVRFHLHGRRYRKDGLPGKRYEYICLYTENDLK